MSRWLDLAAQMEGSGEPCANSAISANRAETAPNDTTGTNGTQALPSPIVGGLKRLREMAAPRITRPEVWLAIVTDALRLASDGWAAQALALGWSPLDLWGCSPVRGGNVSHDGLAVWIDGRRVLLLDDASCIVEAGSGRSVFNRSSVAPGGVMLWQLGGAA